MSDRFAKLLTNPSGVTLTPLAGDASGRRYARWKHPAFEPMIHMDARNDRPDGIIDFVKIDAHLRSLGLSAPKVLAQSSQELLLEDLGDSLFAAVLKRAPNMETELYLHAADLLTTVQQSPPPENIPQLDTATMVSAISPAFDAYLQGATGVENPSAKEAVSALLETVLMETSPKNPCLLLRDYHAENLLWLADRKGLARVGVLDFQDAHLGHPAYDLASLLEDARRDVSEETRAAVLAHFVAKSGLPEAQFEAGFHIQAAQRNLRILGRLAHLARFEGKRRYLAFLPRVWTHLLRDLSHPSLCDVREILLNVLPPPDAKTLKRLEGPDA